MSAYKREPYYVHSDPEPAPLEPKRLCVICAGEEPKNHPGDGYLACFPCKRHLDERLADLLEFYALTEGELSPGKGGDGRSGDQSIGLRVSALSLLGGHDLLGALGSWERDWRETFQHSDPPPRVQLDRQGYKIRTQTVARSLSEIIGYLRVHLDRACREHPAVDEFAREVRELHGQAKEAARIVQPPSWVVDCPADYEDGDCGRRLRVSSDLDEEVSCRQCGTRWTTRRLLLVAAADSVAAIWLDPTAASEITGISERTIFRWAKSGKVAREHGRVSLGDVRSAMREPGKTA